ncbi:MAG: ATP-binding protein [Hyphomicrobiaceae bacterium]
MAGDITTWLVSLGLERYADVFVENEIDLEALPHLSEDDLKEIGIALGSRRKLLAAIASLDYLQSSASSEHVTAARRLASKAERRQLTVMFCDLVGSTELSRQLDPEELREVMRGYQDAVAGAVIPYGGHIAKYLGDGVLVLFGWPQAYEDQAECAVRASLDVVAAVRDAPVAQSKPLRVRIGIATGQVVVGDLIGERGREEEAVSGEAPNLAARLQQLAGAGQIVLSDTTKRLIGSMFTVEALGGHVLKGFADRVQAWRISGEDFTEGRFETKHFAAESPMVGRETELQLLLDRWQLACDGEGQAVMITGEPGIGKSRLLQGLCAHVGEVEHERVQYQCSPYHANSALYPAIQEINRAAGIVPSDAGNRRIEKLEALLNGDRHRAAAGIQIYSHLLSLPYQERYGALSLPAQKIKEALLEALVDRTRQLAVRRPVLFLFEDAHWSDPTSQEFLEQAIGRFQYERVLLVVAHRPGWRPPTGGHSHVTWLQLNRLGRMRSADIVRSIAGHSLDDDLLTRVVERADGVPLFVEELTKSVVESGSRSADADIPLSLQASLTARLDRLGKAKEVAQIGAAIGRDFSHALLLAVAEISEPDLLLAITQLLQSELVFRWGEPPETSYSFKHSLVRDTAYDSLLFASRRRWHRKIANALEREFIAISEREPEVVANHWLEANEPTRAIPLLLLAGRQASARSSNKEAATHLGKCLALHDLEKAEDRNGTRELQILAALGPALMIANGFGNSEVGEILRRAHALCEQLDDGKHIFPISWNLWLHYQVAGDLEREDEQLEKVTDLAEATKSEEYQLEAHHAVWTTAFSRGDFAKAQRHCTDGLTIYTPEKHHQCTYSYGAHDAGVCGNAHAGAVALLLGFPETASAYGHRAIALAERLGHGPSMTIARGFFSQQCIYRRDPHAIMGACDDAIAVAERYGPPHFRAFAQAGRAWAKVALGHGEEGIDEAEATIELYRRTGAAVRLPVFLSLLAEMYLSLGALSDAETMVDEALSLHAQHAGGNYWAEATRLKAVILSSKSHVDDAQVERVFRDAIEIAARQDAKLLQLRAALGLARRWYERGRILEATSLLSPLYAWFTEGFETPDLKTANELILQLEQES